MKHYILTFVVITSTFAAPATAETRTDYLNLAWERVRAGSELIRNERILCALRISREARDLGRKDLEEKSLSFATQQILKVKSDSIEDREYDDMVLMLIRHMCNKGNMFEFIPLANSLRFWRTRIDVLSHLHDMPWADRQLKEYSYRRLVELKKELKEPSWAGDVINRVLVVFECRKGKLANAMKIVKTMKTSSPRTSEALACVAALHGSRYQVAQMIETSKGIGPYNMIRAWVTSCITAYLNQEYSTARALLLLAAKWILNNQKLIGTHDSISAARAVRLIGFDDIAKKIVNGIQCNSLDEKIASDVEKCWLGRERGDSYARKEALRILDTIITAEPASVLADIRIRNLWFEIGYLANSMKIDLSGLMNRRDRIRDRYFIEFVLGLLGGNHKRVLEEQKLYLYRRH